MSKKRYKKRKRQRADWAAIQAAGKKRSAWAKMGGTLLGGLATLATGGAAAPIVAALAAGGATWLGSKLGDMAARTSREGRAEGTKWYGSQKAGLDEIIKEQIGADALKAGVMGGLGQMGGKLSFGKGGLKVGGEGVTKQNLLKSGKNIFTADKAALGNQKGLGRLLDFRGSQLGGGIEALKAHTNRAFDQARSDIISKSGVNINEYGKITHPDTGEVIGTPKFLGKDGKIVEGEGYYKRGLFGGKDIIKPDAPNMSVLGTDIYEDELDFVPLEEIIDDPGFGEFGNWDTPPPRPLEKGFESQFVDPMGDLRSGSEFQTRSAIDNLNLPDARDYSGRGSLYDNYQGYSGDSWPAETVKTGFQSGGSGFPELKNPFSSPFYSPTGGQFQPKKPKRNFYNSLFGGE